MNEAEFENNILLWVHEEQLGSKTLTEIININHENIKYFPGFKLPQNIVADSDISKCICEADVIIFVVPHQFLGNILNVIKSKQMRVRPNVIAVSLIKGLYFKENGPELISEMIMNALYISKQNIAVLSGPTIASEVASDNCTSATLACESNYTVSILKSLFLSKHFKLDYSEDVEGVQILGALKNVIALAAGRKIKSALSEIYNIMHLFKGFCDGMEMSCCTKAMILCKGVSEMSRFCQIFDPKFKV
jgi:glycerol-3-phosphate dehydrogenase (NAD+)